jgi:predicted protein tyrosine phosphatase
MSQKRRKLQSKDLKGYKYFKAITSLMEGLHSASCQWDKAGNRTLHMDQYMALILLYMFNPICSSLRALQQASELKKVQRILGVPRASLGSLSEAARVFDSTLMEAIVTDLAKRLKPVNPHAKLDDLNGVITLIDGTTLSSLVKLTTAAWDCDKTGAKAHTHFDLEKYVPIKMTITEAHGNEKQQLSNHLEPGRIYVKDRGYACFSLFQTILDNNSSFVCRVRDDSVYESLQEYSIPEEASKAGVIFDKKVILGSSPSHQQQLTKPVRIIAIACTPHPKRNRGPAQGEMILIVTDLFDLDADVIALIYQKRWCIETFFRFFKHILGCRHLLSHCQNGIELQTYAAIIACMLISLWTGSKPTLRTYEMLCYYFTGMANLGELMAHINRLKLQDEMG